MTLGMARAVEKGEAAIVAGDVAMVRDVAVVVAPHPRVPLMRYLSLWGRTNKDCRTDALNVKAWYALTCRCPQLKVYVGGISWNIDDKALLDAFSPFGQCEAHIMVDKYTGRSRGFGFVTFQVSLQIPKGETCSDLESSSKYARTIDIMFAH
jgi:hypothetical protein